MSNIEFTDPTDITVYTRGGQIYMFKSARYTEESWCIRIATEEQITRISKNNIEQIIFRT